MDESEASEADVNNTTLPLRSDSTPTQPSTSAGTATQESSRPKRSLPAEFFSLTDILSLAQKVQSTFLMDLPQLGFLDPAGDTVDITKGTKLELPLWLARDLYAEGYIEITVPKGYNETYREILEADSNVVNLHKLCPNFYKLGQHLAGLGLDESEDIAKSLVGTFHQRFHKLVNYSLSATDGTVNEVMNFKDQLDNEEKDIFEVGRKSVEQIKSWENRQIERITANELVVNMRKRKRAFFEENDDH